MVTALVFVDVKPSEVARVGTSIADIEGVREVYSVAGNEDLVAILWVRNHEDIATIVTEKIAALKGVEATRTLIAFRSYSTADRTLV
jgi:DNA-binding Lrp family transcriptional regulator